MDMTEKEAREAMKALGWTYMQRKRRGGRLYVYAERKQAGRKVEKYVGSLASLENMTVEDLQRKLA
jgi:hypothetical protein